MLISVFIQFWTLKRLINIKSAALHVTNRQSPPQTLLIERISHHCDVEIKYSHPSLLTFFPTISGFPKHCIEFKQSNLKCTSVTKHQSPKTTATMKTQQKLLWKKKKRIMPITVMTAYQCTLIFSVFVDTNCFLQVKTDKSLVWAVNPVLKLRCLQQETHKETKPVNNPFTLTNTHTNYGWLAQHGKGVLRPWLMGRRQKEQHLFNVMYVLVCRCPSLYWDSII